MHQAQSERRDDTCDEAEKAQRRDEEQHLKVKTPGQEAAAGRETSKLLDPINSEFKCRRGREGERMPVPSQNCRTIHGNRLCNDTPLSV